LLACLALAFPAPVQANHAQRLMVEKINKVRARNGLRPFRRSPSLTRTSSRFARWLMARDLLAHRARVSASRRFRRLGEALAMHTGRKPGVRGTLRAWLASPPHRQIVLTRSMRWAGVGLSRGRFGRRRAVIWVLQTGKL
jgi:uncharacterized protein YkwD